MVSQLHSFNNEREKINSLEFKNRKEGVMLQKMSCEAWEEISENLERLQRRGLTTKVIHIW
jgi:hypothetical protein